MHRSHSENSDRNDFEVVECDATQGSDGFDLSRYVESWKPLETPDQRRGRDHLDQVIIVGWLLCLCVALVRFAITGDYIPVVAILGVPLTALLGYYYLERKGKRKKKGS